MRKEEAPMWPFGKSKKQRDEEARQLAFQKGEAERRARLSGRPTSSRSAPARYDSDDFLNPASLLNPLNPLSPLSPINTINDPSTNYCAPSHSAPSHHGTSSSWDSGSSSSSSSYDSGSSSSSDSSSSCSSGG